MTQPDSQRQRLKNKASQHNDAKQNRKDNAKKARGSFTFKGLSDKSITPGSTKVKTKSRTLTSAKKFATSRFGVAVITTAIVSSLFMAEDAFSNFKTQDNLDTAAVGKQPQQEPGNNKIFPNPPSPLEDTLLPANVGDQGLEVNPQRSVAIGDSTVAWANGNQLPNSISGCDTDKNTWAYNLGMRNLSCAGMTTREISTMIQRHHQVIKDSDATFITAGSNDIRGDKVGDLDNGIEELIATIKNINPDTQIIFVGYLPAYIDDSCMEIKDRNSARRLYDYHRKANYAMQDAALRHDMRYIDVFHSPFPVCDKDKSFVRIPSHKTQGVLWHTTEEGHTKIAADINGFITFVK